MRHILSILIMGVIACPFVFVMDGCSEKKPIGLSREQLLEQATDSTNVYGEKGIELLNYIDETIDYPEGMRWDEKFAIEDMVIEDISSVFDVLDNLSLQHGVGLGVLLAYNDWDHGVSHAYTYNLNKGAKEQLKKTDSQPQNGYHGYDFVFDVRLESSCIEVEPTEMGAWQFFLLNHSYSMMPAIGHGYYFRNTYIFKLSDLLSAKPDLFGFPEGEHSDPLAKFDFSTCKDILLPTVERRDSLFDVTCCYWNDWEGLVRQQTTYSLSDNRKMVFQSDTTQTLFRFEGIIQF